MLKANPNNFLSQQELFQNLGFAVLGLLLLAVILLGIIWFGTMKDEC